MARTLPIDRRDLGGPFDIIGDVHGCIDELEELLERLHDAGPARVVVYVGDLVDRGPDMPAVLRQVMSDVAAGRALSVIGNHDDKLLRKLRGRNVQIKHGLERSLEQLASESEALRQRVADFLDSLPSHLVLDGRRLVVAHAGLEAWMIGRDDRRIREFALYGATTGRIDEHGMPERLDWTARYRDSAYLAYGHTPVEKPEWRGRTVDIDTGCVFGGKLTALRYPEMEFVSVPARAAYAERGRPFLRWGPGGPPFDAEVGAGGGLWPAAEARPGADRVIRSPGEH
jgi:protein phosphatase